jgi:hypothetical protein
MIMGVLLIVPTLVVLMDLPVAPPVADAGVKADTSLGNTVLGGLGVLGTGEVDLFHLPLGVLVPQVAIVFDHLALGMPEPLANLPFRGSAQERPDEVCLVALDAACSIAFAGKRSRPRLPAG